MVAVRLRKRTVQFAIFELTTAGVYFLAGQRTDQAGLRQVRGTGGPDYQ